MPHRRPRAQGPAALAEQPAVDDAATAHFMQRYEMLLQDSKGRMEAPLAVQREFRKLGRVAALRRHRAPAGVVREQPQGQRHRSAWRIFNDVDIPEERMATAKVFRSGNSQAVRLHKEFRLDVDEVEIFRQD